MALTDPIHALSVGDAGRLIRERSLTSRDLVEHALDRIDRLDSRVHAFVELTWRIARDRADCADRELREGYDRGPLHGIPYGLKDIFDVAGVITTCQSHLRKDRVAKTNSDVETRLCSAGAVLLGKLTTHEFALGGPSRELPFPPARNPWDFDRFTGGSSSGSAAAVAAGFLPVAVGTDTSGSVRGPASLCGVVGLKPTLGSISLRGAYPLSYSLDHCGVFGRSVEDAAALFEVLAEFPHDRTMSRRSLPPDLSTPLRDVRIGYARTSCIDAGSIQPEVLRLLDRSAEILAQLGAQVELVELPEAEWFEACGRIIMTAEGYAIHEKQLRKQPEDYGRYTYQRLLPGAGLRASDLIRAYQLRKQLTTQVESTIFARYELLLCASSFSEAPRLDEFADDWPPPAHLGGKYTIPFNVTGHPALAVPSGLTPSGLPAGIQLVGRFFQEQRLLQAGGAYATARGPICATVHGFNALENKGLSPIKPPREP